MINCTIESIYMSLFISSHIGHGLTKIHAGIIVNVIGVLMTSHISNTKTMYKEF